MMNVYFPTDDPTAWANRQGGNAVRVGHRLLYPSGARTNDTYTMREEPPTDTRSRLRRQEEYHAARLKRTEGEVKQLDAALRGYTDFPWTWPAKRYGPAPAGGGPAALAFLHRLADEDRLRLTEIQAEIAVLDSLPGTVVVRPA